MKKIAWQWISRFSTLLHFAQFLDMYTYCTLLYLHLITNFVKLTFLKSQIVNWFHEILSSESILVFSSHCTLWNNLWTQDWVTFTVSKKRCPTKMFAFFFFFSIIFLFFFQVTHLSEESVITLLNERKDTLKSLHLEGESSSDKSF